MKKRQKDILDYLLRHSDGVTADELMSHLGITMTAVRGHLSGLENLGYLRFEDLSGQVGRPKRHYFLTKEGTEVFPRQYSWLSNEVLELLAEELGSEEVTHFMQRLADKVSRELSKKIKFHKPIERLNETLKLLNDLGYKAEIKQSDIRKGAVIEATNCVYHTVAQAHSELCNFDIRLLKNVSNMNVKLESCIARGGSVCRFCFRKAD